MAETPNVLKGGSWVPKKATELYNQATQNIQDIKNIAGQKIQQTLDKVDIQKGAPDDVEISTDPVKKLLIFPEKNNRTYRSGYIQLMAFANDFNLKNIQGDTASYLEERAKNTKARKPAPTFNADDPAAYLANARANLKKSRKMPGTKLVFSCIMPLPLSVNESTQVSWQSAPSGFNRQVISGSYEAGADVMQWAVDSNVGKGLVGLANEAGSLAINGINKLGGNLKMDDALAAKFIRSQVLGTSPVTEMFVNSNGAYHQAAMQSIAGAAVTNPNKELVALGGNVMTHLQEAAAMSGRRQIVMDPGYWAQFQGVNPRSFTLRWTIIPENHHDAMNGLELCARLKEFSLPENVSGVEMLSPHYWQIQFSNPLVQSQLLYGDLVITSIEVTFAEQGEFHLSGTPKKFDIVITFQEARAPNAEIFKKIEGSEDLIWGKPVRSSASRSIASAGTSISSSANRGGLGGSVADKLGGLGSISGKISGSLGNIKNGVLGKLSGIAGGAIGGLANSISNNAGGLVSGVLGDYTGNLVADTISNSINSAGAVLTDSIASGDFSNLGSRMKDAALAGAVGTVTDAVAETVGNYVSKATDYALSTISDTLGGATDWLSDNLGLNTPEEIKAREQLKTKTAEAKAQNDKVKQLKSSLAKIENSNLSEADKQKARDKVEQEYKKAEQLSNEVKKAQRAAKEATENAKVSAEDVKKAKEKADNSKTAKSELDKLLSS